MIKKTLISIVARCWLFTFRYRVNGRRQVETLMAENRHLVFTVWHNQLLCALGQAGWINLVTMISRSRDGEYFAGVVEKLGIKVVRASSSRGASAGTLEMLEEMAKGTHAVMAADGPKGPKYEAKSGSLYLAKKSDGIIIPIMCNCKNFYRFKSWDGFILPKPFSKIELTLCEPIFFNASLEKEDMEKDLALLQKKMTELTSEYSENII